MQEVTAGGIPLSQLSGPVAPANPDTNLPGDREFIELLRGGSFPDAKRRFPELYNNPHVAFLAQLTGLPAPADHDGAIEPLTEVQFMAAVDYLEGSTKQQ